MKLVSVLILGACAAACGDVSDTGPDARTNTDVQDASPDVPIDTPVDVPPPSDASTATTCKTIHAAQPTLPSGPRTIDPDGDGGADPLTVYCDMATAGGGWTVVFTAGNLNYTSEAIAYAVDSPALRAAATEALLGYRTVDGVPLGGWARLPMPEEWRTRTPFAYAQQDVATMVSVDDHPAVAATLRYGYRNFTDYCDSPWSSSSDPATYWGRICITGTRAPFYNGWATTAVDSCSDSGVYNATTSCSGDRRFAIALR